MNGRGAVKRRGGGVRNEEKEILWEKRNQRQKNREKEVYDTGEDNWENETNVKQERGTEIVVQ